MKYVNTMIVLDEIPDEITLAINISGCIIHCPDCHSKQLWEDIGEPLDIETLKKLIDTNQGITCVCFMGGEEDEVAEFAKYIRTEYSDLKTAWYTGKENVKGESLTFLNYVKTGPYKKEFGPLNSRMTNQRFYVVQHNKFLNNNGKAQQINLLIDYTNKFWKHENSSM